MRFGSSDIHLWTDLGAAVQRAQVGEHVEVTIRRGGAVVTERVQLTQADVPTPIAGMAGAPSSAPAAPVPSPENSCMPLPYRVLPLPEDAARRVAANPQCRYDRTQLLALDEQHFDQDLANGGWRGVAARPSCESVAADLVRDYQETHGSHSGILYWHEGQLRAMAGDYKRAITAMEHALNPLNTDDLSGWNLYVDATIDFLKRDRAALLEARTRLAAIRPMNGEQVQDGFVSERTSSGQEVKVRWPANLDVVDGLVHCFDKPYRAAYASECRSLGTAPVP